MKKPFIKIGTLLLSLILLTGCLLPVEVSAKRNSHSKAQTWMKDVVDDAYLNAMNIPGSHDSGMYYNTDLTHVYALTQSLCIYDQLMAGGRIFDIRLRYAGHNHAQICHGQGSALRYDAVISSMDFGENHGYLEPGKNAPYYYEYALHEISDFLAKYPSEVVILTVQHEYQADDEASDYSADPSEKYDIVSAMKSAEDELGFDLDASHGGRVIRIRKEDRMNVPYKLGEVRGCVILFEYGVGFGDLMPSERNEYDVSFADKWNVLKPYFESAPNQGIKDIKSADKFRACYTSSTGQYAYDETGNKVKNNSYIPFTDLVLPSPDHEGAIMRRLILDYPFDEGAYYGWISMDFLDEDLARKIFETNDFYGVRNRVKNNVFVYVSDIKGFCDADYKDALQECLRQGYKVVEGTRADGSKFRNVNPDGYVILLGYKTTTDASDAIRSIVGTYGDNGPERYTKVQVDNSLFNYFTRGSGWDSEYTYLYYTKGGAKSPITELQLVEGESGKYDMIKEDGTNRVFNLQKGLDRTYTLSAKRSTDLFKNIGTLVSSGNIFLLIACVVIVTLVVILITMRNKYKKA